MKKLLLFTLLCLPAVVNAQRLKNSRAYVGAVLQDGRFGGSLILSYGINPYIGIGAGVDVLSYRRESGEDAKFFAPFYADLRLKYPGKGIEPFVYGQFGKHAYENKKVFYSGISQTIQERGKYFYGAGGGVAIKRNGAVGGFISVTYRDYRFNASPDYVFVNGSKIDFDRSQGFVMFSAGIVF
jgi:hypothetical protein